MQTELTILRVFGLSSAEVSSILRQARADGCPGLRLLERDGEFAVCIQASAPNTAMASEHCRKWANRLRAKFGDAVYGTGEINLAQATLNALLEKRKLIVAADETTGRLLSAPLQVLEHSEAVFDFGTETYGSPTRARQIAELSPLARKFPDDVVQVAAGRASQALAVAKADYAVLYMPATVGQCPFVLLCDKKGAVASAVSPEAGDATIANSLLDLARRRALGLQQETGTISFRLGHDHPLLVVSNEGRSRGTTTRFSLRKGRRVEPVTSDTLPRADFEPMLDFDAPRPQPIRREQEPQTEPETGADKPSLWEDDTHQDLGPLPVSDKFPTGAIVFEELEEQREKRETKEPEPAGEFVMPTPVVKKTVPDPMDIRTAGPAAAADARAKRPEPAPSLLDEEIPDFTAAIPPAPTLSDGEEFRRAANRLFDADGEASYNASAARSNRSLARIEKAERRRRRLVAVLMVLLVLVLAGVGAGIWWFRQNDLGVVPSPKNYGTTLYDTAAVSYLQKGAAKTGAAGYLAFPEQDGEFFYPAGAVSETPVYTVPGENWLGSAAPGHTLLFKSGGSLATWQTMETAEANSAFTLYLPDRTYRYEVVAAYYGTPGVEGEFDPSRFTDLSGYYDYMTFVANVTARSLYDTGVTVGDSDSFVTLCTDTSDREGAWFYVTGRLIAEGERSTHAAARYAASETALLPTLLYQQQGQSAPLAAALLAQRVNDYAQASTARAAAAAAEQGDTAGEDGKTASEIAQNIAELGEQTSQILTSANEFLKGLTDIAGQAGAAEADLTQGAQGALPQQTVTVDQIVASQPTPPPTAAPTPAGTDATQPPESTGTDAPPPEGTDTTPPPESPTAPPATEAPPPAPSTTGETINVNMNGTNQTMDLVQCLAMVAQNELGSNAPAEAYKAQCVATHCWILSQGGYPAVLGQNPGPAALAAAQEVARVLVTYNGQVCFTPYFASASTGTASSKDVWGGERAWLQAVDSPYDQQVATNWHTTGETSGSARFSRETLQNRIKEVMDFDFSGVDPNEWFTILSTNQYGWVAQMRIGPENGENDTCSGRWFRENLLARQSVDGRSLRSQCFTFRYDAELDCFIFDVYGYGHGCGMSQWGAIGYARNGWSYQDILLHYFPGTTLTTY